MTHADLHYVGSVTVDADLLEAANLLPGELVHIADSTNGARLETYTIAGPRGTGIFRINGAADHLVHPGDLVILIAYAHVDDDEAAALQPHVVFIDSANAIIDQGSNASAVTAGHGLVPGDRMRAPAPHRDAR